MVEQSNIEWASWAIKGLATVVVGGLAYFLKKQRADIDALSIQVQKHEEAHNQNRGKIYDRIRESENASRKEVSELRREINEGFRSTQQLILGLHEKGGKEDG